MTLHTLHALDGDSLPAPPWPAWSAATAIPAVDSAPSRESSLGTASDLESVLESTARDGRDGRADRLRGDRLAREVARAAGSFEQVLLGRPPASVTVVGSSSSWMVVHLQERLSPLERRLAGENESGAERVREFHRGLFERTVGPLLEHVRAATGVPLRAGIAHVDVATGCILKTLATGPNLDLIVFGRGLPGLGVPVDEHHRTRGPVERPDGRIARGGEA